jgi:hypothetical protein
MITAWSQRFSCFPIVMRGFCVLGMDYFTFFYFIPKLAFAIRGGGYLRELDDICIRILFLFSGIDFEAGGSGRKGRWVVAVDGDKVRTRDIVAVLSYSLH